MLYMLLGGLIGTSFVVVAYILGVLNTRAFYHRQGKSEQGLFVQTKDFLCKRDFLCKADKS